MGFTDVEAQATSGLGAPVRPNPGSNWIMAS